MTLLFRAALAAELLLMLLELPGWFPGKLPIAGSHAVQISLVLGSGYLLHEALAMVRDAVKPLRAWLRKWRG